MICVKTLQKNQKNQRIQKNQKIQKSLCPTHPNSPSNSHYITKPSKTNKRWLLGATLTIYICMYMVNVYMLIALLCIYTVLCTLLTEMPTCQMTSCRTDADLPETSGTPVLGRGGQYNNPIGP